MSVVPYNALYGWWMLPYASRAAYAQSRFGTTALERQHNAARYAEAAQGPQLPTFCPGCGCWFPGGVLKPAARWRRL